MLCKHRFHIPWIYSAVEHYGGSGHWRGRKILHLVHPDALEGRVICKAFHILEGAARVRRYKIRYKAHMSAGITVYLVKFLAEALEKLERGFCHLLKNMILSVFRGHF